MRWGCCCAFRDDALCQVERDLQVAAATSQAVAVWEEAELQRVSSCAAHTALELAAISCSLHTAEAAREEVGRRVGEAEAERDAAVEALTRETEHRLAENESRASHVGQLASMQAERIGAMHAEKLALQRELREERERRASAESEVLSMVEAVRRLEEEVQRAGRERGHLEAELKEQASQMADWRGPAEARLEQEQYARFAAEHLVAKREGELQRASGLIEEMTTISHRLVALKRRASHLRLGGLMAGFGRRLVQSAFNSWQRSARALIAAAHAEYIEHMARLQMMQKTMAFQKKLQILEQQAT